MALPWLSERRRNRRPGASFCLQRFPAFLPGVVLGFGRAVGETMIVLDGFRERGHYLVELHGAGADAIGDDRRGAGRGRFRQSALPCPLLHRFVAFHHHLRPQLVGQPNRCLDETASDRRNRMKLRVVDRGTLALTALCRGLGRGDAGRHRRQRRLAWLGEDHLGVSGCGAGNGHDRRRDIPRYLRHRAAGSPDDDFRGASGCFSGDLLLRVRRPQLPPLPLEPTGGEQPGRSSFHCLRALRPRFLRTVRGRRYR